MKVLCSIWYKISSCLSLFKGAFRLGDILQVCMCAPGTSKVGFLHLQ